MREYLTLAPAGLLELLEAMQGIRKHVTDTAGAVDHVFDLCHLLGFRLAPRICDLNDRRLYGLSLLDPWPTLRPSVAAPVTVSAIAADCVGTLRLAVSIRAVTVNASVMLRKLACFRVKTRLPAHCSRSGGLSAPCHARLV